MKGNHSKCKLYVEDLTNEQIEILELIMKPDRSKDFRSRFEEAFQRLNSNLLIENSENKFDEANLSMACSQKGFLGENDNLKEIAAKDFEYLKSKNISFEEFADLLEKYYLEVCRENPRSIMAYQGYQFCPFSCVISKSKQINYIACNADFIIEKKIRVSSLVLHLIRDHHFFEGNTEYRVDPQIILEDLDLGSLLKDNPVKTLLSFYPYFFYTCPNCQTSRFKKPTICDICKEKMVKNIDFDSLTNDLKILIGSWIEGNFDLSEKITQFFKTAPEIQHYYNETSALITVITWTSNELIGLQIRLENLLKNAFNLNINEISNNKIRFQEFLKNQITMLDEKLEKLKQSINYKSFDSINFYHQVNDFFLKGSINTAILRSVIATEDDRRKIRQIWNLTTECMMPSENLAKLMKEPLNFMKLSHDDKAKMMKEPQNPMNIMHHNMESCAILIQFSNSELIKNGS